MLRISHGIRTAAAFVLLAGMLCPAGEASTLDMVVFGDSISEQLHSLTANLGETINGQLSQPARRLLPKNPVEVNGGDLTFTMAVDPVRRNYFTVKLWGGDDTNYDMGRLYLYIPLNGVTYQVGYRHEGDYMPLSVTAGKPPLPGRFFYSTTLLPLWMTKGKTSLTLRIQSTGKLYGLGSGGPPSGNYQYNMTLPSRGIYRGYTHTEPMLDVSGETQGTAPSSITRPAVTESSVLGSSGTFTTGLKNWVSGRLSAAVTAFTTVAVQYLAEAYFTPEVTTGYNNSAVIDKVVAVVDAFCTRYYEQPVLSLTDTKYAIADGFTVDYTTDGGNEVWGGRFGHLGWAIHLLRDQLASRLDQTVDYGAGGVRTRRAAWGDMLFASRESGRFNRNGRAITNQALAANTNIYRANRGLLALGDSRAFTEDAAQRYLKEACGLLPWLGNDSTTPVTSYKYGSQYNQTTPKGMTREWGYVGGYGEMAGYAARYFKMTGNTAFKDQAVKMTSARAPFRRPALELVGSAYYNTMERTGLLAWRGVRECDGDFANEITYAEPASWASGMRVAGATLDPTAVGYAKQMLADNQYLNNLVADTRYYTSLTVDSQGVFETFADYAAVKNAADSGIRLPMTDGQPDFVWSDEVSGIVALKRGSERMWVAPFWQAKTGTGINGVARFHYSTATYDQYGVLETTPQFRASGYTIRPNYIDKPESTGYTPPDNPSNAYAGERLPLGFTPADAQDGAPFRGRVDFYAFRFGKYLFGLNASTNSYALKVPATGFASGSTTNLITRSSVTTNANGMVAVAPTNSVVLELSSATDNNVIPQPPLLVTAAGNSTPAVVLNWSDSAGAESYTIKRSTTQGGPYSALKDDEGGDITTTETTFTDYNVIAGDVYYYVVSASGANGTSYDSMEASTSAGLESPWQDGDVGTVGLAGNASLIKQVFTLTGTGSNVGGSADSFHFTSLPITGDGVLVARLASRIIGNIADDKVGLMIREDTTAGAKNFSLFLDALYKDAPRVTYRGSMNGGTAGLQDGAIVTIPQWMKVERVGNVFRGYVSSDAITWTLTGEINITMNPTVRFGMFVCSRDSVALNTSTFDGVTASNGWGYAPDAPSGLNAMSGSGAVGLTWSPVAGAQTYRIKRATIPGGPYTTVGTTTKSNYTDSNLTNGAIYYYVVSAANSVGESGNSNEVEVTPSEAPPAAPVGLGAVSGNGFVTLSWAASYGATGYNVKRSTSSSGPFTTLSNGAGITASTFTDNSVTDGTTYFYLVTALGPGGESGNSTIASATPSAVPPAPLGLQAIAGNGSAVLAWPPSLGATSYNLKRSTTATGPFTAVASGLTSTSFADSGLTNGTAYYYVLSAVNAGGESANSDVASVTPSTTVMSSPYTFQDIGAVGIKGASSRSSGAFTMVASGADIWNTADEFGYVYVPVNGDCTVTARVASLQNVNASAKAGVMIRETTDANSKYAIAAMTPGGTFLFQYRSSTGSSAAQVTSSARSIPYWVRLVRSGNTITAYRSSNGSRWSQVGTALTVFMTTRVYVGLALTSHDNTKTASAAFSNFSVSSSGTLAAPTGLSVTALSSSAVLSWTALTGATSYNIQRATSLDGTYTTIATGITGTTYTDSTAASGTTYYYRISASSSSGAGWSSGSVAAIPKNWIPSGLSAVGGNAQVLLSWTAIADAEGYRVWRATSPGGNFVSVGIVTSAGFTDSTATNGTQYFYKITAMRGGTEGDASSIAAATPQSASTGLAGKWATPVAATKLPVTTISNSTNLTVGTHSLAVGDLVQPTNSFSGFTANYSYWVVAVGGNTVSLSATQGGAPITPSAATTNTNTLRSAQRWSIASNWTNNVIPSGVDAVAMFPYGSPATDVAAIHVDMDVILGKLSYSNNSGVADFTLTTGISNTLRFAVSGTDTALARPMIEIPYASTRRLNLGGANAPLRIVGSQGLLLRVSYKGQTTNGIAPNPDKEVQVQNVDWSEFAGGVAVDRGVLNPATANKLPAQELTFGSDFSTTNNVLAGLRLTTVQTIGALSGNSMGRVYGSATLTVGMNNTGGDFGGIIGQEFNGIKDSNALVKIGTNRQEMSGVIVGNGGVDVAAGTMVFSGTGTNTFSGAITVSNGAALYLNSTHAAMAPYASVTLAGTSGLASFTSSVPLKNDDVVRATATNAGLALATEYYVVGTPTAATTVQLATNKAGINPVTATATANATVQFSSTTNGVGGLYTIASGGILGGRGRMAPFDTIGGTNPAISISGKLSPGPEGMGAYGSITFDGSRCVRNLLKLETGSTVSFRVGASTGDRVAVVNAEANDITFTGNVLDFTDTSEGLLPTQTVLFSADASGVYKGLTTDSSGLITAGVSIGSGLSAYPNAALYVRDNNIVLRLAPPPPTTLTIVGGDRQISLTWSAVSSATSYSIYRSLAEDGLFERIAERVSSINYKDSNLLPGKTYYYRVCSIGDTVESEDYAVAYAATSVTAKQMWRIVYFGIADETAAGADAADPDHDGRSNLMEYALGSNPTNAEASLPATVAISTNGPRLTFTFSRTNDPTLVYTVSGADTIAGTNAWTNTVWTSTGTNNSAGLVTVPDNVTTAEKSQRFLRLEVR